MIMKYYKVEFRVEPRSEEACDVLSALLADEGFETFVPGEQGLTAYVQQQLYDEEAVRGIVDNFLMPDCNISFTCEAAPDEDWNETWEAEGFEPIVIDSLVCVHDTNHPAPKTCDYDIIVNPRMAFGTGTHPTTQQILRQLCSMDLEGLRVVDAGCGTGVLGFLCAKRGASEVFAYDIDEWSVSNTLVNAELNNIYNIKVCEGDSAVLPQDGEFDLLIANINRNILLGDMPRFANALREGGRLLLSGFYEADAQSLIDRAREFGLEPEKSSQQSSWALLLLIRGARKGKG